jgi:hypothetical protein
MPPLTLAHALENADWEAAALMLLLGLVQALEALPTDEASRLLRMADADAALA